MRWKRIARVAMGCVAGLFLGSSAWRYLDFRARPDLYAVQSAPWYTPILVRGVAAAVVLLCLAVLLWKKRKQ